MISDLLKISLIISEILPVAFTLYLLLITSEISKNRFYPQLIRNNLVFLKIGLVFIV